MGGKSITLPEYLSTRIQSRIAETEFDSVESYTVFVLEEVLAELDEPIAEDTATRQEVEERLQSLGYIE